MTSLIDQLSKYASYHRDRRNIATHYIGIPMIVAAVLILLSRPAFMHADGVAITPALIAAIIAAVYYLRLDVKLGLAMTAFLMFGLWLGQLVAAQSTMVWLTWGIGLFFVGWVFQFVGHYYEGKKPAFVDDIMGLAIGPIFVAAELAFDLGLRDELRHEIESRVGPTLIRQMTAA